MMAKLAGWDSDTTTINNINISLPSIVDNFILLYNCPNPFNPSTKIIFELSKKMTVGIEIFSIDGKHIKTLINQKLNKGQHSAVWSGENSSGDFVSGGIYIYRITSDNYSKSKKMILLK